ncbi:DUF2339 domain-containing protein [uncultured Helicobacter sp.]|uniref:DUF2339 domain-containing protein n=1 Tax=uncultured Helicobacter sp. TaxID=175537 RepID=UPI0027DE3226|nr:DUF2339 domain-containing protein [uncultured Helicobacter sp.]
MVFIAGVFYPCSIFLIRYSLENNLLTPFARIILGIVFGFILVISGILIQTQSTQNNARTSRMKIKITTLATYIQISRFKALFSRTNPSQTKNLQNKSLQDSKATFSKILPTSLATISQTLIGSGVVMLYFAFYGGYKIYDFFGYLGYFGALSLISLMALALCLYRGIIVGIFGIIGGFLTPFLLQGNEPNLLFLFGYLSVFYLLGLFLALKQILYTHNSGKLLYATIHIFMPTFYAT